MIPRYHLLAERLRSELQQLEKVVTRTEGALVRARQNVQDQDYFIAAAALDLHSFYAGLERLFELIAADVDKSQPTTPRWHRDLLIQMTIAASGLRPAVIRLESYNALAEYLEFRHVVRNVYTFNLRPLRVIELIEGLRPVFALVQQDLLTFAAFLDELSNADQEVA
ncbi:MAG: hypothetical protein U0350_03100 [Caldilineaceae bacterium]